DRCCPDLWGVGGDVGFVAEEVLGGSPVGRGAVAPPGVTVEGVETCGVTADLSPVGAGEALDIGAVDGYRRWTLELWWQARLDEQGSDLVLGNLLARAVDGAGEYLTG